MRFLMRCATFTPNEQKQEHNNNSSENSTKSVKSINSESKGWGFRWILQMFSSSGNVRYDQERDQISSCTKPDTPSDNSISLQDNFDGFIVNPKAEINLGSFALHPHTAKDNSKSPICDKYAFNEKGSVSDENEISSSGLKRLFDDRDDVSSFKVEANNQILEHSSGNEREDERTGDEYDEVRKDENCHDDIDRSIVSPDKDTACSQTSQEIDPNDKVLEDKDDDVVNQSVAISDYVNTSLASEEIYSNDKVPHDKKEEDEQIMKSDFTSITPPLPNNPKRLHKSLSSNNDGDIKNKESRLPAKALKLKELRRLASNWSKNCSHVFHSQLTTLKERPSREDCDSADESDGYIYEQGSGENAFDECELRSRWDYSLEVMARKGKRAKYG